MPNTAGQVDLAYALGLAPEKAIEYFKSKGYATTWDWHELWQEAHVKAFTVAKAMRLDILQDIRGMVQKALDEGITFQQFKKELEPRLKAKGWWGRVMVGDEAGAQSIQLGSPWRLKTIYQTNVQTAYMAGRYRTMMENTDNRPFWQYVAVLDSRTRPAHRALDGQVFRYDDPFWDTHYPPLGFNCRCRVRALSKGDVQDRGLTVEDSKDKLTEAQALVSQKTGEMAPVTGFKTHDRFTGKPVTVTPDPGWNYNPGKAQYQLDLLTAKKARKANPEDRRQLIDDMAKTTVRDSTFSAWVNETAKKKKTAGQGNIVTAGWLSNDVINWLEDNKKITVETPVILVQDKQIIHAMRDAKSSPVNLDDLRSLPKALRDPEAILFDEHDPCLLYITSAKEKGFKNKYVISINYSEGKISGINFFNTATKVETTVLANDSRFTLIMGQLRNK